MAHALEFRRGGRLIHNEWVYDESVGEGSYVEKDITDNWFHKRDYPCSLQEGVTLNDIFVFIGRELEICDVIFVNAFAKAMWEDWKKVIHQTRIVRADDFYHPDAIEYLELYWNPEICEWDNVKTIEGDNRACFHGIGYELREDRPENDQHQPWGKKGDRTNWGIGFSPIIELTDLPIRLNETFDVKDDWRKFKHDIKNVPSLISCKKHFSFEQIITGALWELSFYGSEEKKNEKKAELDAMVNELGDHT